LQGKVQQAVQIETKKLKLQEKRKKRWWRIKKLYSLQNAIRVGICHCHEEFKHILRCAQEARLEK
jgi:hypothetical protein